MWAKHVAPVLTIVGLIGLWRVAQLDFREPLFDAAALCVVASIPLVPIQHWWPYHSMLFLAPLGVLAIPGLELVLRWGRRSIPFVLAASLLPSIVVGQRVNELARHDFAVSTDARQEYQQN